MRRRGFDRTARIADVLQKALAQLLLQDGTDDRLKLLTVLDVTVARDHSSAKVYVSVLLDDEAEIKGMIADLNRSAKTIRYQVAKMVKLRIIPELKFVYDESTVRGFRISSLIEDAVKKNKGE